MLTVIAPLSFVFQKGMKSARTRCTVIFTHEKMHTKPQILRVSVLRLGRRYWLTNRCM